MLPFQNLGGDPDEDYFSDGLTEEMIAQLGNLQPARLGVIARTSAMRYKKTGKPIDEIGRELKVDYVLEGSVRRAGGQVRITAQLIQVTDQTHLWAENYDRALSNIFAIQNDVAGRIARSLALELLPARRAALENAPNRSPAAYEAYLKGRYYWNRRTEEELKKGLERFEQAVAIDPDYALAHVGIADSYNMLADYGALAPGEALPQAIVAARRALSLNPDLAEALAAQTWAEWVFNLNWEAAEQGFERAAALNPSYATTYQLYAHYLRTLGRREEALVEAKRARELDPLSLIINAVLGWHYYLARDPDKAIEQCKQTIEIDPNFPRVHSYLGWAYLQKGLAKEAIVEMERARDLFGESPARTAELAHVYAVAGRKADARRLLRELEAISREKYVDADLIAKIHLGLGERDEALEWLESAFSDHSVKRVMLGVDPLLDPLRSERRFQDLLKRSGFPGT